MSAIDQSFRRQRRDLLRLGGGLALASAPWSSGLLSGRLLAAGADSAERTRPARSCILVYLLGGPSHLDTFDLKPRAAAEVRGPFSPIATSDPGVQICEHLPHLAGMFSKYALVRSVSLRNSNHTPMIYYTLTGRHTALPEQDNDVRPPQRSDFPHLGAVLSNFRAAPDGLPGYVAIPEVAVRSSTSGEFKRARTPLRGGGAGFLGVRFDPLTVNGEPGTADAVSAFAAPDGASERAIAQRATLLAALEDRRPEVGLARKYSELREQALLLTGSSSAARTAFSLDGESASTRHRYGDNRFGKALLLARRLATIGVPMVAVHFNEMTLCDGWDTHSKNFEDLQRELLPMLDQGLSALISDLDDRGQLGETLVMCLGEFGRTPKINANAGRDHWGPCSSALIAGGGIRGGQVLGSSDAIAAYPTSDPIDPADLHATMYAGLGVSPREHVRDVSGRPWEICTGRVLNELF